MKWILTGMAVVAFSLITGIASAQTMTPPTKEPIKRTPLQKIEYPDGHFTYILLVEVEANSTVARHTHPGIESAYVLEGEGELLIDGNPPIAIKPGVSFAIQPGTPHSATTRDKPVRLIATLVVDKTKPLASPAP